MPPLLEGPTVLGLPLHALVVHFAVVLVPAGAAALIFAGWKPEWRQKYLLPALAIAVAGAAAAVITAASGESLEETVRNSARAAGSRASFGDHPEQGDMARNLAVLVAFAGAGLFVIQQWGRQLSVPSWSGTAAYVLTSAVGLAAIITIVVAGHSGATLVWKDVGNFVSQR